MARLKPFPFKTNIQLWLNLLKQMKAPKSCGSCFVVKPRVAILAIIPNGMFGTKTTLHITETSSCPRRSIVRNWTGTLFKVINNDLVFGVI